MSQLFEAVLAAIDRLDVWGVADIAVVALLIYGLLSLVRGTTASSVLYGFLVFLLAVLVIRGLPELVLLNWLLLNSLPLLSMALLILFQPELRRAMERIGRVRALLNRPLSPVPVASIERAISEVAGSCRILAQQRQGALIVLQRETGLQEYVETGTAVDGAVTTRLLLSLFYPNSPLHDGAVIVNGDRVVAAGCRLPVSQRHLDPALGLRHRAALGVTEETDAIALTVSEETGGISLANNGRIEREIDPGKLERILGVLLRPQGREPLPFWRQARARHLARRRVGAVGGEEPDPQPATPAGRGA